MGHRGVESPVRKATTAAGSRRLDGRPRARSAEAHDPTDSSPSCPRVLGGPGTGVGCLPPVVSSPYRTGARAADGVSLQRPDNLGACCGPYPQPSARLQRRAKRRLQPASFFRRPLRGEGSGRSRLDLKGPLHLHYRAQPDTSGCPSTRTPRARLGTRRYLAGPPPAAPGDLTRTIHSAFVLQLPDSQRSLKEILQWKSY